MPLLSDRFAVVLLLGAIPLFFIGSYPAAFAYLAAFNAAAVGFWAWDRTQVDVALLAAAREHREQWILDRPERVVLQLTSTSGFPMTVDVREALPATVDMAHLTEYEPPPVREADLTGAAEIAIAALGVGLPGGGDPQRLPVPVRRLEPELPDLPEDDDTATLPVLLPHPTALVPQRLELAPHQTVRLAYQLTPTVRGPLDLGRVTVRVHGPLGLAWRQKTFEVGQVVEVVPQLPLPAKLGSVEARPDAGDAGMTSSRVKGSGVELESLREYVPGDEFRKISWKATARRGRTMVKETVQEISQQVVVLLDVGRRMGIPVGESDTRTLRLDLALDATLLIGRAALQQGDKVGLWTFAEDVRSFLKPSRGRKQWVSMGHTLQRIIPNQAPSDYVAVATHLLTMVKRRSLVVLLTEPPLGSELAGMGQAMSLLGARHRLVVMSMQDPVLLAGAEPTGDRRDTAVRRSAAADILAQRRAAVTELQRTGVTVLDVPPADLTLQFLQRMIKASRRR